MRLAAVVLVAMTACSRSDPDTERLERQIEALNHKVAELEQQLAAARKPADGAGVLADLPDCASYLQLVPAYTRCEQLPEPARAATLKAVEAMRSTLSSTMSPDARKAANAACRTGVEALRVGAEAIGCLIAEREP